MGISYNTSLVRDGLVLHLDAANKKSYSGAGTTWTDMSSAGNNNTLVNGVGYSTSNNGTMTFDGIDDWTQSTSLKPSGPRSYFIWVKYNTVTSLPGGFSLSGTQDASSYNYVGVVNGGAFYYYAGLNGGTISTFLSANVWYQQGFVLFADGSRKVYLNGNEILSTTGSIGTVPTTSFFIGRVASGHYVNGSIPMVTHYNRSLTALEVNRNFSATRGRYGV